MCDKFPVGCPEFNGIEKCRDYFNPVGISDEYDRIRNLVRQQPEMKDTAVRIQDEF